MTPFSAPLDDILFTLTHVAGADRIEGWDGELVAAILEHFSRFAEEEIAPLNAIGDAEGCRLENGQVILPAAFAAAYASFCEQGWPSLAVPEAYDGQGQSATVLGATTEIFIGACHALHMLVGLVPGGIRVLREFASEEQRARLIAPSAPARRKVAGASPVKRSSFPAAARTCPAASCISSWPAPARWRRARAACRSLPVPPISLMAAAVRFPSSASRKSSASTPRRPARWRLTAPKPN